MCAFLISSLHESEWLALLLYSGTKGLRCPLGRRLGGLQNLCKFGGYYLSIYLFILLFIICLTALSVAQIRAMVSNWRVICGSTPSRLVIDFNTQCACAILFSVACPALHYFSSLSHKW